jgi:DNA-binding response OmpR family regulator
MMPRSREAGSLARLVPGIAGKPGKQPKKQVVYLFLANAPDTDSVTLEPIVNFRLPYFFTVLLRFHHRDSEGDMLLMVDGRQLVIAGYETGFAAEGVALAGFAPTDFLTWIESAPVHEVAAIEAFILGECDIRVACARAIALRSQAPVIAINDANALEATLSLFAEGFDDVVRKPVHVRELLARLGAIRRRASRNARVVARAPSAGAVNVFFDGRDPEIDGVALNLPRRERRILEFMIANRGRRVTKTQIFNAIYGIFDEEVEENVIESHISKLRKKLRSRLGYDPIDSKRFLGYCIELDADRVEADMSMRQAA